MNRSDGIGSWLERASRKAGHRPAMTYSGRTTTYAAVRSRVVRLAHGLSGLGVERGSRVAYLGGNHPAFLESLFATATLGAVFVPLNARLSAAEIDFMLGDAGAVVLLCGGGSLLTVESLDVTARPRLIAVEGGLDGALDYANVIATAADGRIDARIDPDEPCMIMYTSGTTGRPKGAMLSHGNITWNSLNVLVDLDLRSDEVTLVTAPMFHTAALNMTCMPTLLKGGHLLIESRFDAAAVIDTIERMRVTLLFGVPTMFTALTQSPRWATADLSSLRLLLCGGAPVPKSLINAYVERGLSFVQGYGMTETAPGALMVDPRLGRATVGAAGVAHFFTDVRLLRDDGAEAEPGEPGEVVIAGPNVMRGYWGLPDATEQAFIDRRWFRSGDVGVADDQGVITIVDRLTDVYISGGENVYPAEVEKALCDHPAVAEAAVIGVADDTWGEVGMAFVVLHPGRAATADELIAHLRNRLAGYKIPRSLVFRDLLPHTASGKVFKSPLRTESASPQRVGD
ncbi:MAG TPA: long-chain fatty acid--CoA ligase [Candidatus Saccharimonadales bacterium]|nr:long-chain fatty acid--CoA ligase [Candidatus Saccharimonadales bacterium]